MPFMWINRALVVKCLKWLGIDVNCGKMIIVSYLEEKYDNKKLG